MKDKKEITVRGIEVPTYLTRKFIKTGMTNPDYVEILCASIVVESKKEMWSVAYMNSKIVCLKDMIETENKRLVSFQLQKKEIEGECVCAKCGRVNVAYFQTCAECGARVCGVRL